MNMATGAETDLTQEVADIFNLGSADSPTPASTPTPAAPAAPEAGAEVVAPSAAPAAPASAEPSTPASQEVLPPLTQTPPASATPAPTPAPAPASAAPTPTVDEAALKARSMEAQLEAMSAELAALRAGKPAVPGETPAPTPGSDPAQPEVVQYGLQIPNEVAAAIFGEDAAKAHQGLNHLVSSLASVIHTRVQQQFRQELQQVQQTITTQSSEAEAAASREAAQNLYYKHFPTHNTPIIQPIIAAVNRQLAAELPHHPWDDNYVAALGQRVNAELAKIAGTAVAPTPTPAPAPTPTPSPAARPAAMVPTQSRSAIPAFETELPDQVLDILG